MGELNPNQHHTLSNSLKLEHGKGIYRNYACQLGLEFSLILLTS